MKIYALDKDQAIAAINEANQYLKIKWQLTPRAIDAIQTEYGEKEVGGVFEMELRAHETLSGHCEFITIEGRGALTQD